MASGFSYVLCAYVEGGGRPGKGSYSVPVKASSNNIFPLTRNY
jgi:hypothetical protein